MTITNEPSSHEEMVNLLHEGYKIKADNILRSSDDDKSKNDQLKDLCDVLKRGMDKTCGDPGPCNTAYATCCIGKTQSQVQAICLPAYLACMSR